MAEFARPAPSPTAHIEELSSTRAWLLSKLLVPTHLYGQQLPNAFARLPAPGGSRRMNNVNWEALLDARSSENERVRLYKARAALSVGLEQALKDGLGLFIGEVDVPGLGGVWQHGVAVALRQDDLALVEAVLERLQDLLPAIAVRESEAHSFDPRPYRRLNIVEATIWPDRATFLAINEVFGLYEIRLSPAGRAGATSVERTLFKAADLRGLLVEVARSFFHQAAPDARGRYAANDPRQPGDPA